MLSNLYSIGRISTFVSPHKVILGAGAAATVGAEAKLLGGGKALIVTDPGVVRAGLTERVKESLLFEKVDVDIYDRVENETPAHVIDECAAMAREGGYTLIVALGGGTSIDTAKGASLMARNQGKVLDYAGIDLVPNKGLPKIFMPTTAGSGSEVTKVFGVTDEAEKTKKVVYTAHNLADTVILDPMLTLTLPPILTADTGIDSLAHAIEGYVSANATPFSDLLAVEAIKLISESLLAAYAKGDNVAARYNMVLAAALAGMSWAGSGLGAVHALSFTLETEHGLGHGRAVSVMLPHVMEYNKIGNLEKYAVIAQVMGEKIDALTVHEAAEQSVTGVRRLLGALNISTRLLDYGISMADIPRLVDGAMKQARLFVPNPRNLTTEDVRRIYVRALE